jgi:hypothetical protein
MGLAALASEPFCSVEHKIRFQTSKALNETVVGFDEDVLMACDFNAMLDEFDGVRRLVLHLEF